MSVHANTSPLKPIKGYVKVGSLVLSPVGAGTWSWGNKFLWGYSEDNDKELMRAYEYLLDKGQDLVTCDALKSTYIFHFGMDDHHRYYYTCIDRTVGVTWFDTADSYGTGSLKGRAEKLLGKFDAEYKQRRRSKSPALFATKLAPFPTRIGKESMYQAGLESMERLQRPIDIVQLHWPPFWVVPQVVCS